jgi:hypothetical protein
MDMKKICLALIAAESEEQVDEILAGIPEMNDAKNWVPLDRRETNYNVTTNQQASGPKAATELMTNMVDAILLKHARMKGIDPRSSTAPETMHDAVEQFFGLKGGRMINEDRKWLADFASKNLVVGITGARTKAKGFPCYTFADNGEGQDADEFDDTFLSLSKGNKKDIHFVQGKFNMGSSGVLSYCGRRWYKLIVSRKWNKKKPWGWTIMRRRPGGGMPVAEYFKLGGEKGKIPTAEMDMVFPMKNRDGKRYDGFSLDSGTIVKLYDFQIGNKFLSFRGAREALIENLVDTILPFRILDLRQTPDPARGGDRALGVDARPFYGMEYLLLRSHADESDKGSEDGDETEPAADEEKIGIDTIDDPAMGRIEIHAVKLKRKIPKWLEDSNNRVFHAVNGQVQFKQTRGFLTTCKLPALKDRVIVTVDASRLTYEAHNDIWKSDRESIRETIEGERYKEIVKESLTNSEILKKLQNEIAQEELKMAVDEKSNDLFQKLVDSDKNLAALLGSRDPTIRVPGGGGAPDGDGEDPFEGEYSPTYVRFSKRFKENGISLPINKSRPVIASTDVRNDFFVRDVNTGDLLYGDPSFAEKFVVRRSLRDGQLTIYLNPVVDRLQVGDEFTLRIGLKDDAMPEAVWDEITVRIEAAEKDKEKIKHPPKPPKPGKSDDKPSVGLPPHKLLTKDGRNEAGQETEKWPDGMTELDGGFVKDLGDGVKVYCINYDNAYHQGYRRAQRGQIARDSVSQKYILGMRVFMLGVERAISGRAEGDNEEFDPDVLRTLAAKGAAATMLTLSDHLPKIIQPAQDQPE